MMATIVLSLAATAFATEAPLTKDFAAGVGIVHSGHFSGLVKPGPASLEQKIGQMILVGFLGTSPQDAWPQKLQEQIAAGHVGSIIVYGVNIVDPHQISSLNSFFASAPGPAPLLIAVDQEGGKVQRLNAQNGFEDFLSAKGVATGMSADQAKVYYERMAGQVAATHFNLVFGPVVDLESEQPNSIIGGRERSFGGSPDTVVAYADAFIDAFHRHGIKTSLKHFPGHGSANGDTHLGMVDTTNVWTRSELEPFLRLIRSQRVDMIMTAHIFNKNLDDRYVATLSPNVLNGILRKEGGFGGVIITDDMFMQAIDQEYGFQDSVIRAIEAGADILLFSNTPGGKPASFRPDPNLPEKMIGLISKAVRDGRLSEGRIDESYGRILSLKSSLKR